jgi:hypothetical protein
MCYYMHVENRVASLVIDATDAELLARFWAAALGWQLIKRGSYGVSIGIDGGPFEIDFRSVCTSISSPSAATRRPSLTGCLPWVPGRSTWARELAAGMCLPIPRATSSACAVPDLRVRLLQRRSAVSNSNVGNRADVQNRIAGERVHNGTSGRVRGHRGLGGQARAPGRVHRRVEGGAGRGGLVGQALAAAQQAAVQVVVTDRRDRW